MSQGAYAYRIRIADAPESWDADNASVERSKKIADTLAKCSVHVTAWKSTFLRCETNLHIDKLLGLLHFVDVKPEDITLERQIASLSGHSLGCLEPCLPISRVVLVLLGVLVKNLR